MQIVHRTFVYIDIGMQLLYFILLDDDFEIKSKYYSFFIISSCLEVWVVKMTLFFGTCFILNVFKLSADFYFYFTTLERWNFDKITKIYYKIHNRLN